MRNAFPCVGNPSVSSIRNCLPDIQLSMCVGGLPYPTEKTAYQLDEKTAYHKLKKVLTVERKNFLPRMEKTPYLTREKSP